MTTPWWEKPCWRCGGHPVAYSCGWFEGQSGGRICCYNYPRCKPLTTKTVPHACDICNRDNVDTYIIVYPDLKDCNRFCARCISETNGLRITSGIIIIDQSGRKYPIDIFPHPNMRSYEQYQHKFI
jgi:hypothetical protein